MPVPDKAVSKFLSYVLRHHPEEIGLNLDAGGWVNLMTLIEQVNIHFKKAVLDPERLRCIVANSEKQRFAIDEERGVIRANQGHSLELELNHPEADPPTLLYHGTAERFIASIRQSGLTKQGRHAVHLTADRDLAKQTGSRHGKPLVLSILARSMLMHGFKFQLTPNSVWLTEHVPPIYIV